MQRYRSPRDEGVLAVSSTSSGRQLRKPDDHTCWGGVTVPPTDDEQQNAVSASSVQALCHWTWIHDRFWLGRFRYFDKDVNKTQSFQDPDKTMIQLTSDLSTMASLTRMMYWRRASVQDAQASTSAHGDATVLKRFFFAITSLFFVEDRKE